MDDEAFEAAIGEAEAEEGEGVEEGVDFCGRHGVKLDAEQAGGARKIAFPEGVAGVGFQGGMEDAGDLRVLFKPSCDFEGRSFVLRHPERE